MDIPIEIASQHAVPPAVETEIRNRVDKLDRLYEHLIGCRVSVEQLHRRPSHWQPCTTSSIICACPATKSWSGANRITPAKNSPTRMSESRCANAFKAAERRLLDYKRKQRGEVKVHAEAFAGQVSQLDPEEDHGFILTHEGSQLLFSPQHPDPPPISTALRSATKCISSRPTATPGRSPARSWRVEASQASPVFIGAVAAHEAAKKRPGKGGRFSWVSVRRRRDPPSAPCPWSPG